MLNKKIIVAVALVGALAAVAVAGFADRSEPVAQSRAYLHAHNVPADGVAIDGYCPVAYFAANKPIKGRAEFASEHRGITYWFVSADAKKLFDKDPAKYVPAYGGWCAFGMSVKDKFPIDPTSFKIVDDRLYLFLRNAKVDARKLWNAGNEKEGIQKAGAHWRRVQG